MFGGVSLFVAQDPAGSSRGGELCTLGLFFEPIGRPFAFGCTHFAGKMRGDLASGESPRARLRPPAIQLLSFSSGGFVRCLFFVVVGFAYVLPTQSWDCLLYILDCSLLVNRNHMRNDVITFRIAQLSIEAPNALPSL